MVFEKVKELICDKLSVEQSEISMETSFVDDLGADSLDVVELIMAIEDEFDIEVADEEAENMNTVGDAVEYIKEHIQE